MVVRFADAVQIPHLRQPPLSCVLLSVIQTRIFRYRISPVFPGNHHHFTIISVRRHGGKPVVAKRQLPSEKQHYYQYSHFRFVFVASIVFSRY